MDEIEKFISNYLIVSTIQYNDTFVRKFDFPIADTKRVFRRYSYVILGLNEKKVYICTDEKIREKSFSLKEHSDLTFLSKYKVEKGDKVLLQCDKIKPLANGGYKDFYSINDVWIGYTYVTKQGKERMVINSNLFSKYDKSTMRNMTLDKILEK